ncbi:MAG: hypothetical protein ACOY0T_35970 [Myxococcota bacterium]
MMKSFILGFAALSSFACSAAVGDAGGDEDTTLEQALGAASATCPGTIAVSTAAGVTNVGASGQQRPIRGRISGSTMLCEATGDAIPGFTLTFSGGAQRVFGLSSLGTFSVRTEGADFVVTFKLFGLINAQTERRSCPAQGYTTSASGWNSSSGNLTARAAVVNGSATNFQGTCTYTLPATSARVSLPKPAAVFTAIGSSFYAKSALSDTELSNVCNSTCSTQCTSNIPGGRLDGVAECIRSCVASCVRR